MWTLGTSPRCQRSPQAPHGTDKAPLTRFACQEPWIKFLPLKPQVIQILATPHQCPLVFITGFGRGEPPEGRGEGEAFSRGGDFARPKAEDGGAVAPAKKDGFAELWKLVKPTQRERKRRNRLASQ